MILYSITLLVVELPRFCPYNQCAMFPVGLNIEICVHNICIIFVCACVHRDWRFEAFVDVKISGAGDDLLSSAAGKPRYIQLKRLR